MAKSDKLRTAKANKNDEFYTLIDDIINEIAQHKDYVKHFEGKTVFCNCDDPEWSSFVEFFRKFFKKLKLKKMISTHYNPDGSPSYKLEWSGEKINGDTVNMIKTPLKGNGDFRSDECIELLKEADIVVTNPPFSLFREYVAQLIEYNKEFVIIGSINSIAYKEFFPYLKEGLISTGYGFNKTMEFIMPDSYALKGKAYIDDDGKKHGFVPGICWYTNLDLDKAHDPKQLNKNYYGNEDKYPKYDNFDAIECSKVSDIPKDYFPCWYKCKYANECIYAQTEGKEDKALCEIKKNDDCTILGLIEEGEGRSPEDAVQRTQSRACNGIIGVPITYLAEFCREQFRIIGSGTGDAAKQIGVTPNYRGRTDLALSNNGKNRCPYNRILIQRLPQV